MGVAAQHVGLAQATCGGRRGRRRPPRSTRRGRSRPPPRRPCAARPGGAGGVRRAKVATAVSGKRKAAGHQVRLATTHSGPEARNVRAACHTPQRMQLADLPGVVVDAVEHLADGLLGELGQRLGHGGVEQVGAQLSLGAVADRRPRSSWRPCRSPPRPRRTSPAGPAACDVASSARRPATIEPRDAAIAPTQRHREAEPRQRTADPAPVDGHATRPAARPRRRWPVRCGRRGVDDGHGATRLGVAPTVAPPVFRRGSTTRPARERATTPRPLTRGRGVGTGWAQTSN